LQLKSEPTGKSLIDQIFQEIKNFENLCLELKDFGARDTEPDGVFQRLINAASMGGQPAIPRSGQGWDLYSHSVDCEDAANRMHDQALKVVRLIESCPVKDFELLRGRIKDYCWRLY
jgi:hypothetical protein